MPTHPRGDGRVATEVYLPMLSNPRQQEVWPQLVTKDIVDGSTGFVANIQIMQGQVRFLSARLVDMPLSATALGSMPPSWLCDVV